MNLIKTVYSKIPKEIREQHDLEPFYEYCLKNGIDKPLIRGIEHSFNTKFVVASSPENKIDDTVNRYVFQFFKNLLKYAGFEALPNNSIFVTFDEYHARSYGYVHYVFPIGNDYHYTFSEMVDDYMSLSIKMERIAPTPYQLEELYGELFPPILRFLKNYTNDERFQLAFKDHVSRISTIKKFNYEPESVSSYAHTLFSRLEKAKYYDVRLIMNIWYFLVILYKTGKESILKLLADCGIRSLDDLKPNPSAAKNLLTALKYHNDSDLHLAQNIIPTWNVAPEIMFRGKYLLVSKNHLEEYE